MKLRISQLTSLLLVSSLLLSSLLLLTPKVKAEGEPTAHVRFIPGIVDATTEYQMITVACVIEDAYNLSGIDIMFSWDDTYLTYSSHTLTFPVEDYPTPQAPSPYPGILHAPKLELVNAVVDNTYQAAIATLGGPAFNGSGTLVVITFQVSYLPWDFEIAPDLYIDTLLHFISIDLARSTPAGGPGGLTWTWEDGIVRVWGKPFEYPNWPLLKVTDQDGSLETPANELIKGVPACTNCEFDVWLLSKNETTGIYEGLDRFWDVAGIDVVMHFNTTLLEAVSITVDPDGDFAAFWPNGISVTLAEIDNPAGTVSVAFSGVPGISPPGVHTAPFGFIKMFSVEFHALYDASTYPPPKEPIYLEGPIAYTGRYEFHSQTLIDLAAPMGTEWLELTPHILDGPYEVIGWTDNGDGEVSVSDQLEFLNTDTGYYYDYHVSDLRGTLNLTLETWTDFDKWATNSITEGGLANFGLPGAPTAPTDPNAYNGFGVPDWTGNFTVTFPFLGVNEIIVHALPYTADEFTYTLTPGVDYEVHVGDQFIELLNPVDEYIVNECWTDGVNNSLGGWPWINYVATGIQSVYVVMPNGTSRFGRNLGFELPPPAEWWYEPDWPWELEGWWALGYYSGPYNWPANSTWYLNYTAASWLEVSYFVEPTTVFVDYDGSYADFLALTDGTNTVWNEIYPRAWQSYNFTTYIDGGAADFSVGDRLATATGIGYYIESMGTDLTLDRKPWICDENPADPFFGVKPIVEVAGWAHPEKDYCPWHSAIYAVKLPHNVEEAYFEAYFLPPGAWIDLYVCDGTRPDPFGGQGPNQPSDMFWPQKEVTLCANVTYNFWPEQYKDVAFHIYMPNAELYAVLYAKTDENGHAVVTFRLPWPCDEWPDVIGVWHIEAFVDVACVVVNDTLEFHYDYLVNIVNVETDKDVYKHCEDILVTVTFTSHAQMPQNVTITVTLVDETGVPFGYAEVPATVGGAVFCTPNQYMVEVTLHVVKWARAGEATVFAGSLAYRGDPAGPGFEPPPTFGILAEWA